MKTRMIYHWFNLIWTRSFCCRSFLLSRLLLHLHLSGAVRGRKQNKAMYEEKKTFCDNRTKSPKYTQLFEWTARPMPPLFALAEYVFTLIWTGWWNLHLLSSSSIQKEKVFLWICTSSWTWVPVPPAFNSRWWRSMDNLLGIKIWLNWFRQKNVSDGGTKDGGRKDYEALFTTSFNS